MKYKAVLFDYAGTLDGPGEQGWVTQMLHDLFEAGYRLGIVSNSNRYGDARWLRDRVCHNKWNAYLECVCGSGGMFSRQDVADLGCHKPDRRIYDRALHFLGLETYPHRVLFIGDNYKADVVGPRMIGLDAMQVDSRIEDYSTRLWTTLDDSPANKRFNVLTEYSIGYPSMESNKLNKQSVTEVTTHLRHLTEPLAHAQEIIVGLNVYKVVSWDIEHTKEDILNTTKNHRQLITIAAIAIA